MHKDEAKGTARELKGDIKNAVGKATDDEDLQAEGNMDKAAGKVQQGIGKMKDAARDALKN
jgi:uncharacterized protein YjbJ (UPF0337 family)